MNLLQELNRITADAFEQAGLDRKYGAVQVSNRPDLCEYQCNGALSAAKEYHKAPILIAQAVVPYLAENAAFSKAEAVAPGFINLDLSEAFLAGFVAQMACSERFGAETSESRKIVVDYGGPNVAKPLHVGHLRSAIIGESVKRILRYMGNECIGDTHLGDWGLQIGLIIMRLQEMHPELPYFDEGFEGDYPEEAPFTISELEVIYPEASKKSKEDPEFAEKAHQATVELQKGRRGYRALWQHIIRVSVSDLKRNYDDLDVHFELWKKESDAEPFIPELLQTLKDKGLARYSEGALVVDVQEESDKVQIPPCIVQKSDGGSLYATTDLATVIMRMKEISPDDIIYFADKRQELHYTQFFRVSRKAGLVKPETGLTFIGFGTINGTDGKALKTREGGVVRLETLIADVHEKVREKMRLRYGDEELDPETVHRIALSALKYGDLQNQAGKNYIMDFDRFTSFEGNTGPYILYTTVRIRSILRKAGVSEGTVNGEALKGLRVEKPSLKALLKTAAQWPAMMEGAAKELAPHKICAFLHDLSDAFNSFYHETSILYEEDEKQKSAYIELLKFILELLTTGIHLLGFDAPEKM